MYCSSVWPIDLLIFDTWKRPSFTIQESHCILDGITPKFHIVYHVALIVLATGFLWHGLKYATLSRGIPWNTFLSLVFWYTHSPKRSCLNRENTSDSWYISGFTTRKCWITSLFVRFFYVKLCYAVSAVRNSFASIANVVNSFKYYARNAKFGVRS